MFTKLIQRLKKTTDGGGVSETDLRREAGYYAALLSKKLEQLDICYRYRKSEKDLIEKGVRRVVFSLAITQPEAIWLRIDTSPRKFPRGVSLAAINRPEILNDLSVSAERPVRFKQAGDGAWLMIERDSGVFGIRNVSFGEMLANWPEKSRKELLLPFGLTTNRRLIIESLIEFPHVLIGGATQSGKTTLTHAWICALAVKNPADKLNLVLIDLKGGVEYTRYKKLPHLWQSETRDGDMTNGFIKDRNKVIPVLEALRFEVDNRLARFERAGGMQTIAAWNHYHRRDPMPRIVVFIDELASLMLEPDLKKDAERLLADIGARGRAPGIHLVIATQRPEVSVVSGRIKGNIDCRVCFRVPDNTSSMVILDDISGSQFPEDTPRGRYIYKYGNTRREIQGPWIGPGVIHDKVAGILTGDVALQNDPTPDPEAIFAFALDEFGGAFPLNRLFKALRGKGVTDRYLRYLAREYENELIEIRGDVYILRPPSGDFEPRKLIKASDIDNAESEDHNHSDIDTTTQPTTQTAIVLAETTRAATRNDTPPVTHYDAQDFTTIEAVLEFAVAHLDGRLSNRELYGHFRKITSKELGNLLSEYDNATVSVNGLLYFCEPSRGNKPRRLKPIEENINGTKN